jgi:hypothetical protein
MGINLSVNMYEVTEMKTRKEKYHSRSLLSVKKNEIMNYSGVHILYKFIFAIFNFPLLCYPFTADTNLFKTTHTIYYEGKSVNKSQKSMKKILSEIFT